MAFLPARLNELERPDRRQVAVAAILAALVCGLAFLPLTAAIGLIAGGLTAVAILIRPVLGLYLLAFTIPFGSLAEVRVAGIGFDPSQAILAGAFFGWVVRSARTHRLGGAPIARRPLIILIGAWIAYLGAVALSVPDAVEVAPGFKEIAKWLEFGLVFCLTTRLIDNAGRVRHLLVALLIAATAEALVGWSQFVFRVGPEGFQLGRALRAYGTYGQPNPFAGYLNTVWPIAYLIALAQGRRALARWRRRNAPGRARALQWAMLAALPPVAIGLGIGLSFSRGAWIAWAAGLLTVNLLLGPRARFWSLLAAILAALILLAGASNLLPATISDRIVTAAQNFAVFDARTARLTPENWPIVERMATWQAGWEMFVDYPLLGVGAGNYDAAYPEYRLKPWPTPPGHAHNFYLNALAETGIIGLSAYLALLGAAFGWVVSLGRAGWSAIGDGDRFLPARWYLIGLAGCLTGLSVHNVLDNLYVHGTTIQLALLLGLAGAIVSQRATVARPVSERFAD